MAEWMGVEFTSWLLIAGAVALVLLVTWKVKCQDSLFVGFGGAYCSSVQT